MVIQGEIIGMSQKIVPALQSILAISQKPMDHGDLLCQYNKKMMPIREETMYK